MITFQKETKERWTRWFAPKIGKEQLTIREYQKGVFDLFVHNDDYGVDYIGTFDDISKAKREANAQYEIFGMLLNKKEKAH